MGVGVEVGIFVKVGIDICAGPVEVAVSVESDSAAVSEGGCVGVSVSVDLIDVAETEGVGVVDVVCAIRAGRLHDRAHPISRLITMTNFRVVLM